jgi:putative transposase
MAKIRRPIITNATYFITSVTGQRKQWFSQPRLAQVVVDQWKHYARAYQFRLDAYTIMPDHYHVVLNVGEKKTISQILQAVNSYTTTRINDILGYTSKTKIWQGEARDEVIRNENMYWQKVAYTLFNPWRAKLVRDPIEVFPFSNIRDWLDREGIEFVLDLFSQYKRWAE